MKIRCKYTKNQKGIQGMELIEEISLKDIKYAGAVVQAALDISRRPPPFTFSLDLQDFARKLDYAHKVAKIAVQEIEDAHSLALKQSKQAAELEAN